MKAQKILLVVVIIGLGLVYIFGDRERAQSFREEFPKIRKEVLAKLEGGDEESTQEYEVMYESEGSDSTGRDDVTDSLDERSVAEIQKCFKNIRLEAPRLTPIAGQIMSDLGPQKGEKYLITENHHYLLDSGERRVIQLLSNVSGANEKVRLFSLDRENLPIPLRLSKRESALSITELLGEYGQQGTQLKSEIVYQQEFESGYAQVTQVNKSILGLSVMTSRSGSLECAPNVSGTVSCRCKF